MIRINLLPVELRQVEIKASFFPWRRLFIGVGTVLLLIHAYQVLAFFFGRGTLRHLHAQVVRLKPSVQESDQLSQTVQNDLIPHRNFLGQYVTPDIFLSRVMNELSDLLPQSMWFSRIRLAREANAVRLEISGYTRITSKEIALAQIQDYVNAARTKLEELQNIQAAGETAGAPVKMKAVFTTNREKLGTTEVMQFNATFAHG